MSFQILFGKCKQLRKIESKLDRLLTMGAEIMAFLTEIREEVVRNRTVIGSNRVLLEGLSAKLDEFAEQPEQIRALAAELRNDVDGFAADVVAHTPSEEDPTDPEDPIDPEDPTQP